MKKCDDEGLSCRRRYLEKALDKCDETKRRATDPRESEAGMDDLRNNFNRILGSQVTQDQLDAERTARHEIDLIRRVASNIATADQMQSFEKRLRQGKRFQEEARKQLRMYRDQKVEEERDRLYFALGRVLIEERPLPPRGPVLLRADVLGAGNNPDPGAGLPGGVSAEEMARDYAWHPIVTGTDTVEERRTFRTKMLTSVDFYDAVSLARYLYGEQVSEFERNALKRLDSAIQETASLWVAIQTEAVSQLGGHPITRPSGASTSGASTSRVGASGGSASGRSDQARRDAERGASVARPTSFPAEWTITFIEMIANTRDSDEMVQLYRNKFDVDKEFHKQVLRQDKIYRQSKSMAGYEKSLSLRAKLGWRGSSERLRDFEANDDGRLALTRQLVMDRQRQTSEESQEQSSGRASAGPAGARSRSGRSTGTFPLPQPTEPRALAKRIMLTVPDGRDSPEVQMRQYNCAMGKEGATVVPIQVAATPAADSGERLNPSQPQKQQTRGQSTKKSKRG